MLITNCKKKFAKCIINVEKFAVQPNDACYGVQLSRKECDYKYLKCDECRTQINTGRSMTLKDHNGSGHD